MAKKMDKKELQEPDRFMKISSVVVQTFMNYRRHLMIFGAAIVVLFILFSLYTEYAKSVDKKASFALAIAEAELAKNDNKLSPAVLKLFENVIEDYGSTFSGVSAKMKLADMYFKDKKYEKAFGLFKEVYEDSSGVLFRSVSLINLAYIKEVQNDYSAALDYFKKIIAEKLEVFEVQAMFGVSRCLEKLHQVAKARENYQSIVTKYPNTEHAKTAKKYLLMLDI